MSAVPVSGRRTAGTTDGLRQRAPRRSFGRRPGAVAQVGPLPKQAERGRSTAAKHAYGARAPDVYGPLRHARRRPASGQLTGASMITVRRGLAVCGGSSDFSDSGTVGEASSVALSRCVSVVRRGLAMERFDMVVFTVSVPQRVSVCVRVRGGKHRP